MERLFTAQQVLESWNKSCKAIDDVDQEAKDIVREALELKIAEEQGLLLRLPCKVGDTVYQIRVLSKSSRKVLAQVEADAFL